jgi:hypothetical protein
VSIEEPTDTDSSTDANNRLLLAGLLAFSREATLNTVFGAAVERNADCALQQNDKIGRAIRDMSKKEYNRFAIGK